MNDSAEFAPRSDAELQAAASVFSKCLVDMAAELPKKLTGADKPAQIRDSATMAVAICNELSYSEVGLPIPRIHFGEKD